MNLDEKLREIAIKAGRPLGWSEADPLMLDALREAAEVGAREQREALEAARQLIRSLGRHDADLRSEYGRWSCFSCRRWIAERRGGMFYCYPHADDCEIGATLTKIDAVLGKDSKR